MNTSKNTINVIVEGKRKGDTSNYWNGKTFSILSPWERGSEQEKFEVLSAIRKIYNPEERCDIRGKTGQTPSQIGQSEGFTHLLYQRADAPDEVIVIIKPLAGYSCLRPQSETALASASAKKYGPQRPRREKAPTVFVCGRLR